MSKLIIFITLIFFSVLTFSASKDKSKFDITTARPVDSKTIEFWECKETYGSWEKILVNATVAEGRKSGTINVAGVVQKAQFMVKGFNRRWDFGINQESTYDYAFLIKPNGDASYYDFSLEDRSKPSMYLKCRQK